MIHSIQKAGQQGFTLIEVLVSMVILSIGVLGLGVLQLTSLQNTQGGYMRSQATIHAYSIVDAMRANIPAVTNRDFDITFNAATPQAGQCYGLLADCTTTQMADADVARWRTLLGNQLPNGSGSITTVDLGATTQVTIRVRWVDPYSADNGVETLTLVSVLPK